MCRETLRFLDMPDEENADETTFIDIAGWVSSAGLHSSCTASES